MENKSETFGKVVEAIGKVQQELEIMKRESTADAGKFSYTYTSLPFMWVALKPLLAKYELMVMQSPVSGSTGDMLITEVHHSSGEWVRYAMRLVSTREDPQGFGSAITYAERYMLKTIFKVVTDDDNDATTQRLATGEMRKDWVRAYTIIAKKANPDKNPTYNDFSTFIEEVYGKKLNAIMAKEHQTVLDTINAFDPEPTKEEDN